MEYYQINIRGLAEKSLYWNSLVFAKAISVVVGAGGWSWRIFFVWFAVFTVDNLDFPTDDTPIALFGGGEPLFE